MTLVSSEQPSARIAGYEEPRGFSISIQPKTEPIHMRKLKGPLWQLSVMVEQALKEHPSLLNHSVFLVKRLQLALDRSFSTTIESLRLVLPLIEELIAEYQKSPAPVANLSDIESKYYQILELLNDPGQLLPPQTSGKKAVVPSVLDKHLMNLNRVNHNPMSLTELLVGIQSLAVEIEGVAYGFSHVLSVLSPVQYSQLMSFISPAQLLWMLGGDLSGIAQQEKAPLRQLAMSAASFHPATSPLSKPVNWWPEIW